LRWFAEIHHPIDAELVGQHSEASGSERLLEWYGDLAVLAERGEDGVDFRGAYGTTSKSIH
jgi:hypothetical protein